MRFKIVLTGGPQSGKTTTLNALKAELGGDPQFQFIPEQATEYNNAQIAKNPDFKPFKDLLQLNKDVLVSQIEAEDKADQSGTGYSILDRSLIDNIAIVQLLNIGKAENDDIEAQLDQSIKSRPYHLVFILDRLRLKSIVTEVKKTDTTLRNPLEDPDLQHALLNEKYKSYSALHGYHVINVPSVREGTKDELLTVQERVNFINKHIHAFMQKSLVAESTLPNSLFRLFTPKPSLGAVDAGQKPAFSNAMGL